MAKRFLNVGGGSKDVWTPPFFAGWNHVLLDIDPKGQPDICLDARALTTLKGGQFDAIYCSHNLEHYFAHDVKKVLDGFHHVLRPDGFVEIRVPDLGGLFREIVAHQLDIDDVLYRSSRGPVLVRDVIFGFGPEIEESGTEFYAHRTGFTKKSLTGALRRSGFSYSSFTAGRNRELVARGFKTYPSEELRALLGIRA